MSTLRTTMLLAVCLVVAPLWAAPIVEKVTHHHAENDGVKIHYVALGEGPLLVFIHGFPDYWYSWRHQLEALAKDYRVVALDQRGYNQSDKPTGADNYGISHLVGDVVAVIQDNGAEKATLVGHDWGGYVAWSTAMSAPAHVSALVICNLPHPTNLQRELAHNPAQQEASAYARAFQLPGAYKQLSPEILTQIVAKDDVEAQAHYREAFQRSNIEAMLHYYTQNYPRPPYTETGEALPRIGVPVLQFHGLADEALLPGGLNDTWKYLDGPYTLVTVPGAGHWVHHDAPDLINHTLLDWLGRNR